MLCGEAAFEFYAYFLHGSERVCSGPPCVKERLPEAEALSHDLVIFTLNFCKGCTKLGAAWWWFMVP
ncbi:MAG: hypothetical protein ABIK28_00720 [Planctomycetota bacterium]